MSLGEASAQNLVYRVMFNQLPPTQDGAAAWGDYDGDGDFDIAITGNMGARFNGVYSYDGDFTYPGPMGGTVYETRYSFPFNENQPLDVRPPSPFINCTNSSVAWGDYDNDGDVDMAMAGICQGQPGRLVLHANNQSEVLFSFPISLDGVSNGALAWGDHDNDGDLDLAVTGITSDGSYAAWIYENQLRDAVGWVRRDVGLPGLAFGSIEWGDYDADGDHDLLISGISQAKAWVTAVYRNNADGSYSQVDTRFRAMAWSSAAWGDYDADGDLDIAINGGRLSPFMFRGSARVYRNDGGQFNDIGVDLDGGFQGGIDWGDYDGDGDLDLVMSGGTAPLGTRSFRVYQNDGGNGFSPVTQPTGLSNGTAFFGDYDADGDLDAFGLGLRSDGRRTDVLRNELTSGNSAPTAPTELRARREGDALVFTWDAASDAETAAAGLTYNLRVGNLPGGASFLSAMALPNGRRLIPGAGNVGHRLEWELRGLPEGTYYWSVQTIDGSGRTSPFAEEQIFSSNPDDMTPPAAPAGFTAEEGDGFVTLGWQANAEPDVVRYRIFRDTTPNAETRLATLLADNLSYLDTDVENGTTYYYRLRAEDASGNESEYSEEFAVLPRSPFVDAGVTLPGIASGDAAWADYDNDGDDDLILTGQSTSSIGVTSPLTEVFDNDGGTLVMGNKALPALVGSAADWGDYDGDGDLDLALAGTQDGTRVAYIFQNNNGEFLDIGAPLRGLAFAAATWGDYDNDGDLDLILAGDTGSDTVTDIYRNDGGNTFVQLGPTATGGDLPGVAHGSVELDDYDGDGDDDLLLSGNFDGFVVLRIYRNIGSGQFRDILAGFPGLENGEATWGDYDGDNDLDFAVTGSVNGNSVARVYRNDGGAFVDILADFEGRGGRSIAWADYDGDGDLDLALQDAFGETDIFAYDGTAFQNIHVTTMPQDIAFGKVAWGDMDGDGDPDLLVTGNDSNNESTTEVLYNVANEVP